MTRPRQPLQAGTAKERAQAAARSLSKPPSMEFLVFEDNGGGYRWTIIAASGEALVQSARFTSYDAAREASLVVRAGVASALLEELGGDTASGDRASRGDAGVARDDLDADRWLDEGGSFSSDAVTA